MLAICFSSWPWCFTGHAQDTTQGGGSSSGNTQLHVNWIYGAYVAKDQPLLPLTKKQRMTLYVRQTFTTPGIYLKTGLFSIGDQINDSPPEWPSDFGGFTRRFASREGQFVIQNTLSAGGNALLRYEPRYDRCHCSGFWPRTGHAILRNFITYDHTEDVRRPQFASYGAAFAAGTISSSWKPHGDAVSEGYRSMITQAGFGIISNWLGEFSPEIMRIFHKPKSQNGKK